MDRSIEHAEFATCSFLANASGRRGEVIEEYTLPESQVGSPMPFFGTRHKASKLLLVRSVRRGGRSAGRIVSSLAMLMLATGLPPMISRLSNGEFRAGGRVV